MLIILSTGPENSHIKKHITNPCHLCLASFAMLLMLSHSVVSNSFATPWTIAHQAPLFMGFPRQEYWSGLPFLLGDLPVLGIKPSSPVLQEDSLLLSRQGSPVYALSPLQCLCKLIVAPYLCSVLASSV